MIVERAPIAQYCENVWLASWNNKAKPFVDLVRAQDGDVHAAGRFAMATTALGRSMAWLSLSSQTNRTTLVVKSVPL